jgi:hypothetical protein
MAFKDLIVPKWKHSRVDVRLAAIDSIGSDIKILREIAETDLSPKVRIAAIKKIEDERLLEAIIQSEKDEVVLKTAIKLRESLLKKIVASSKDKQAVINALIKYGNEKAIASYLCEHNPDISVQRTLIQQIKNHQLLAKITEHECAFEIAENIVSQITEKEYLELIAKKASNKKIRTIAQEKIDKLFADPLAEEREITRTLKLCCAGMDIRVLPQNCGQALDLLEISRNVWNKYDPKRQHPLAATYAAAEKVLIEGIKLAEAQKQVLETLENICLKMERLVSGTDDAIEDHFTQIQTQWNSLDRTIIQNISTASLDDRFKTACTKMAATIKALKEAAEQIRRHQESSEQALSELALFVDSKAAPDEKTWRQLRARWDTLCSKLSPGEVLKKRFMDVEKKYQEKTNAHLLLEKNTRQDELESVERFVAEMESIARAAPHYARSRYLQAVRLKKEWDKPRPLARARKAELQSAFTNAYEQFMNAYHELSEQNSWRQWASAHVKTNILDEFVRLETGLQHGESLKKIARKISLLESQWRQASGSERETRDLDDRFSAIRNRIFSLALTKKTELLQSLKAVLERSEDGNQTEEVKSFQKEWNDIGYLPPELEKDLPDTFFGLCNAYFEQRKEHYQKYIEEVQKNSKVREEICSEAMKLSDSTDWKGARDAFTQLQKRWDESWPAPHRKSQDLWLQFSKSRDLFFERRHAIETDNDRLKEVLCAEAEQLLTRLRVDEPVAADKETETQSGASPINYASILTSAINLQKAWKESGPGSKERSEELWKRFNGTLRNVFTVIDDEHGKNYGIKEELVRKAEAIALSEDWNSASVQFQEIRDAWKSAGPTAHRDEQALWLRLQTAADTFFGRRRAHFESKKTIVRQSIEDKEKLIAELEILVRIAGKAHLLRTSQTQSAAEILKKGMDLKNQLEVDGDPEKTFNNIKKRALEIIDAWENGEQLQGRDSFELNKRFDELLGILKRR